MAKNGTYRSICTLCHCGCGIVVKVEDGRMTEIHPDTEHPSNRNYLCPKVKCIEELTTSPDRIRTPLKKENGRFVPISWDEAYSIAAEQLSNILEKHGPDGIMRCSGAPVSYGARDGFNYLMRVMGSANATGSSTYCMVPRVTGFVNAVGGKPEPDFDHSDFIILWGSNPKLTNRMGGFCAFDGIQNVLKRARQRKAEIVFIDPVECESIADGDQWVEIEPGTDLVLAMSMIHYIISHDLYDHEFVENHTVGFEDLKKHAESFTTEYASSRTGIPSDVIESLAYRFAKAERATICEGNGLDMYANTVYSVQALAALCGITGRIDAEGGLVFLPFVPQSPINNVNPATMKQKYKYPLFRDIPFPAVKESLINGDEDRPRAMIVHHANPVGINANSPRTKEAMEKLDFLLVSDIFMTATAECADLIIPEKTAFESYGYKAYTSFDRPFAALQRPLFESPEGMKTVFETEYRIAERMGLADQYPYHDELSWIDYSLSPSGITFDKLEKEQIVFLDKHPVYKKYIKAGFNTPSGKMGLSSSKFKNAGYFPMPEDIDGTPNVEKENEEYPLKVINFRPGNFVHTKLHNIKEATKLHPEPLVFMNRETMDKHGIAEGDFITLESRRGKGRFKAIMKASLKTNYIMAEFGWGGPNDNKADINRLTDDDFFDPISGGTPNRLFRARIVPV